MLDSRFEQSGNVVRQALGLREDQLGLVGAAGEQGHARRERHEVLGQHAQVVRRPAVEDGHDDGGRGEGRRGRPALCLGQQPARISFERAREQCPARRSESASSSFEPLRSGRELLDRRRKRGDELSHDLPARAEGARGAVAADEVHARAALVALERCNEHHAHLGGAAGMCSAAGLAVEAFGLDDADARRTPSGGSMPAARASSALSTLTRTGRAVHTTSLVRFSAARARLR